MNKVLAAERMSEAQLIETRTKAEQQRIEAEAKAKIKRVEAEIGAETEARTAQSLAESRLKHAQAEADALRIRNDAEIRALREQALAAEAYSQYPALLRLRELEALSEVSKNANARIFIGFDKHTDLSADTKALMA
jgi:regulator of protease activity HflC (stomatin/prohibitin superfamily)